MIDLIFQLQEGRAPRTAQIRERMLAPLPASEVANLCDIIRQGPGSVADQFAHQAEQARAVSVRWKRTQDFGSRRAPARTLHRTGALEDAWTGRGTGGFARAKGTHGAQVGVDTARFPQAAMFQRSGVTMIQITPKMRGYVGATFGVWFKRTTTRIKVEGRPVSINRTILARARKSITRYYAHGEAAARQQRAA